MRHTSATVALARDLHATGMTPTQIQATLSEIGVAVALTTVMEWVDPDFRERRRNRSRPRRARRERMRRRDQLIRELRADGLSFAAIAVVLRRYHGWQVTEDTVRRRASLMGLPKSQAKVELARRYLHQEAAA